MRSILRVRRFALVLVSCAAIVLFMAFGMGQERAINIIAFGAHPDEFEMPGITLDLVAFREGWAEKKKAKAKSQS